MEADSRKSEVLKIKRYMEKHGWKVTHPIYAISRTKNKDKKTEKPHYVLRLLFPKHAAIKYYGKSFILFHERPRRYPKRFKTVAAMYKYAATRKNSR